MIFLKRDNTATRVLEPFLKILLKISFVLKLLALMVTFINIYKKKQQNYYYNDNDYD